MAVPLKVPEIGESITEVEVGVWHKSEGDAVEMDEPVVVLESDKASVDLPAPASGVLTGIRKRTGESARIGDLLAEIAEGRGEGGSREPDRGAKDSAPKRKEEVEKEDENEEEKEEQREEEKTERRKEKKETKTTEARERERDGRDEEVVPMSAIRRRIAERLVAAQQEAALLTTFNEIDMTEVAALRERHGRSFLELHGVKLGLMSFFVKAAVDALKRVPVLNAEVRGESIAYRNYYDIGIAVGGGKGLVVPVVRNADRLSFAGIEKTIGDLAGKAREGRLDLDDLRGGTFTITNGGIYGSLLSTPIVNPPQSAILGLHAIQDRPVAIEKQVVVRPMMYVALTYDHRVVDGSEAVTFLRRIKDVVEHPVQLLFEA